MICNLIRGRVSKCVTNGSKTAVMDVIDFLFVSLGSGTVQLRNNLDSRRACATSVAGLSSKNGTVLEMYTTESNFLLCVLVGRRTQYKGYS
jgi:hypothetical protein